MGLFEQGNFQREILTSKSDISATRPYNNLKSYAL